MTAMTDDEAAKNLLVGKDCSHCNSCHDGMCEMGSLRHPLPEQQTCALWGMWTKIYVGE